MLDNISTWFASLDTTMQVFWACAIAASVVFVIQNALMLLGIGDMDSDVDADVGTDFDVHADFDHADADITSGHSGHEGTLGSAGIFSLFTLRNFINFFLGFGWGGISLANAIESQALLVVAAILCGLLFVGIFVAMLRFILRLETNGAFSIRDCVGLTASVYLRIPANHKAAGKVQVSVNGSVHELDAFTDGDFLPTGTRVKIVKVIDSGSLLVEPI
ncbi:MAG: NfeD family protein [Bacteroidaceae bacterium]|nr:NfeD family protein [Bacteroidaceae bacterium]